MVELAIAMKAAAAAAQQETLALAVLVTMAIIQPTMVAQEELIIPAEQEMADLVEMMARVVTVHPLAAAAVVPGTMVVQVATVLVAR